MVGTRGTRDVSSTLVASTSTSTLTTSQITLLSSTRVHYSQVRTVSSSTSLIASHT